jgi:hypothetical protein
MDKVKQAKQMADEGTISNYSEKDFKKDMTLVYIQSGVKFVKLYGPSVTLGVLSVACILGAHGIMRKRNLALVAAYKTVEKSFADYRKRVVAELGEEKDREFKYGIEKVKHTVIDGVTGEKSEEVINVVDANGISQYARFFDDTNDNWNRNPEFNKTFILTQQNYANDLLRTQGHLFLNEVYDMLGLKRSTEGSVVGWVMGNGDDIVDFGMFNTTVHGFADEYANDTIAEQRRDFVNGERNSILLDFNVDGVIYDLI